ncbi:MAG: GNAT family N-acetyltransferase [Clostridiales bacterium]|jgi:ribosomal protein S18 acetylase RimI-like enzyme|nr:GNAT family N-acetyltransferase [Clostridiales bacterium]
MMDIQIRKAELSDAAALHMLNTNFNGDCTTIELIIDSLQNNKQEIVLIAYANDKPAGFVCGEIHRSMCYKTKHGSVGELFVEEEYRRHGIATRLIQEVEDIFKKSGIITVDIATSVNNNTAQAVYSSCGYIGKTKMIYRKNI